jgi:hypothetical protein
MKKLRYSIDIEVNKEKVWRTLWDDRTFRIWSNEIDDGTYMVGEMKEGNKLQFISSVSGYGVTSLVEKLIPKEFLLLRHINDTKDQGGADREKEWTTGSESYELKERDGVTTLTVEFDVPVEQEETFEKVFPKALEKLKELAEKA